MTSNNNFGWLANDIDSTIVLKVVKNKDNSEEDYRVFNVFDVLETTGEKLEVVTANIDDLTDLLTIGMVRFVNVINNHDVLDIPFRNLYLLYKEGRVLGNTSEEKMIPLKKLDAFAVLDGVVEEDLLVSSTLIAELSSELNEVMKIASEFLDYGMQEKFDAMSRITLINHQRLMVDRKNRGLK